jgi:hypothetical protein
MRPRVFMPMAVLWMLFSIAAPYRPTWAAPDAAVLRYLSPEDGSVHVRRAATIALRLNGPIAPATVSALLFNVVGERSGSHIGVARLSDDGATVIFKPEALFAFGEIVTVTVTSGLAIENGSIYPGLTANFQISGTDLDGGAARQAVRDAEYGAGLAGAAQAPAGEPGPLVVAPRPQDYITFPDDFPAYTITVPASGTAPGLLFMSPFPIGPVTTTRYLLAADESGEPVYWQALGPHNGFDFKRLWNGQLAYFWVGDGQFHVLDDTYTEVEIVGTGNGYETDEHEFQLLSNGHILLMSYDPQMVDLSVITTGGNVSATVIGLVVQELDLERDVVFQWRSWDHFELTDTGVSLTTAMVDYVHGNAIELDHDGNLLISSRHLDEITKIDRETAAVIWRLGGKMNQFTINDPDGPFAHQHDIRRLPNGNVTLYDNHNPGPFSRAVEYQLNEFTKTADNVWQYRNSPDEYGFATGNFQRLPEGHRLIGWGLGTPNVTEVLTDGTKLFEMSFGAPYFSYRFYRFPWSAVPAWGPDLVAITDTVTPTLHYSWNGATDVAYYEIWAGHGPQHFTLAATQARTGFEDQTELTGPLAAYCVFQVRPVDKAGQFMRVSNMVYTQPTCVGEDWFLPIFFGP